VDPAILGPMPALGAILTAIITPFDADGRVDEDAFVAVQQHCCSTGSDGVVVAGTTGEAPTLSDEEHLRILELAVANKPAGSTVIAGTGSNDTRHAVHLTARATEIGVDGILSVTPYYNRPTPRGIIAHFTEVTKATDKPIVLYNIPTRTGTDMPNELLAELAQLDHVSAVKQANNANLAMVDGLELYAGNDETVARTLDLGGTGGICVATHLLGPLFRALVDEPERRAEIQEELSGYLPALNRANPVSIKAAIEMTGLAPGFLRLPLVEVDDAERAEIRAVLERSGVLEAARS
jgi:4-hydroxy-tetrahydrodipicolinate synthase